MQATRDPPNERMANRVEELNQLTAASVEAAYHGSGVCILTSSRDEFWSDTFSALREHEYEIDKQIDGALYVEKRTDGRRER